MQEDLDHAPNLRKFIATYPEAFFLFEKYGFTYPIVHNHLSYSPSEIVHIKVKNESSTDEDEDHNDFEEQTRLTLLKEALSEYLDCPFSLQLYEELEISDEELIERDNSVSVELTADLSPENLQKKLIEMFGSPMILGRALWIKQKLEELRNTVEEKRAQLKKQFFYAASYMKVNAICKSLTEQNPKETLTTVKIDHIWIGVDSATQLTEMLNVNTSLRSLTLQANKMTVDVARQFSESLTHNTRLTSFDISFNKIASAVKNFSQMLMINRSLTHLNLTGCALHDSGLVTLLSGLKANPTLISLELTYNELKYPGIKLLLSYIGSGHLLLHSLNLSSNKLCNHTMNIIAGLLQKKTSLARLGLRDCYIKEPGIESLCTALCTNQTLRTLDLSGNTLTLSNVRHLSTALSLNTTLRHLSLEKCGLYKEEYPYLTEAVAQSSTLLTLDLSSYGNMNENIPFISVMLAKNDSLTMLVLGEIQISSLMAEAFALSLDKNYRLTRLLCKPLYLSEEPRGKLNAILIRNQQTVKQKRQFFVYILILLNLHCDPWKRMPLDIKLYLINFWDLTRENNIGKNKDQIQECSRFLHTHNQTCYELIKTKQKIVILEKIDSHEKSTFQFFSSPQPVSPEESLEKSTSAQKTSNGVFTNV